MRGGDSPWRIAACADSARAQDDKVYDRLQIRYSHHRLRSCFLEIVILHIDDCHLAHQ